MEEEQPTNKYREARLRASKKWRENNKELLAVQAIEYYHKRCEADPEYKERLRLQANARYWKKKLAKLEKETIS